MSILYIFLSYILGSIPFGYIFTKVSTRKNILEIGWRKTSGSNVFKNIGFLQGFFTGLFDILKGYISVKIAQHYGEPALVQVLCGVAVVIGHNWSLFLNFNGGRGIGTFGGALLAFNPEFLKLFLIPLISLGIIWNLCIGTIVALATVIYYSDKLGLSYIRLFAVLSLLPIFLKRLSPIQELKQSKDKWRLFRNRLIFDDDVTKDFRIKKIVKKLTSK